MQRSQMTNMQQNSELVSGQHPNRCSVSPDSTPAKGSKVSTYTHTHNTPQSRPPGPAIPAQPLELQTSTIQSDTVRSQTMPQEDLAVATVLVAGMEGKLTERDYFCVSPLPGPQFGSR